MLALEGIFLQEKWLRPMKRLPLAFAGVMLITPMIHAATSISAKSFGTTTEGQKVTQYTLTNDKGASVSIINYGGIVTSLKVPDRNGKFADVVLGFKTLSDYEKKSPYFGCLVGRYGNRIAKGSSPSTATLTALPPITTDSPFTADSRDSTRSFGTPCPR